MDATMPVSCTHAPYSRRWPLFADRIISYQAISHGNEPSKGAKIDQELREEEEAELKKKGDFGPKAAN
jgi:hypothetical protein